jgi:hypothetical protein
LHQDRQPPGEFDRAHVGDNQAVGRFSRELYGQVTAARQKDRDIGTRLVVELHFSRAEEWPDVVDLVAAQQAAHDRDRVPQRRHGLVRSESHFLGCRHDPRADADGGAAAGQFVERTGLHRHHRRVAAIGVEYPGIDPQLPGCQSACGGCWQNAASEGVFGEPDTRQA